MARINVSEMEKIEKLRNSVQEEVQATYSTFISNGEKYFQIDMYGSKERLQLDKNNAKVLIDLLKVEFNLK